MTKQLFFFIIIISSLLCFSVCPDDSLSAESAWESAKVVHVIDGDTVILADKRHIRFIGINTPETPKPDKKGEPYGQEAKKYSRKLLKGKKVGLEYDRERKDQYGRTLAWVRLEDGTLVNDLLVREGYAHCLYDRKNHKYRDMLLTSQQKAMKENRGMWKDQHREEGKVVGHTGSFRFHEPHCDLAKRIAKKNRKWFASRWEAFLEGYSPSKKCSLDPLPGKR